jgi:hypothetical protein
VSIAIVIFLCLLIYEKAFSSPIGKEEETGYFPAFFFLLSGFLPVLGGGQRRGYW